MGVRLRCTEGGSSFVVVGKMGFCQAGSTGRCVSTRPTSKFYLNITDITVIGHLRIVFLINRVCLMQILRPAIFHSTAATTAAAWTQCHYGSNSFRVGKWLNTYFRWICLKCGLNCGQTQAQCRYRSNSISGEFLSTQ